MASIAPTRPKRRQRRREFLDDLKAALAIYPITADTAELAGRPAMSQLMRVNVE